jgi:hypothetical protein
MKKVLKNRQDVEDFVRGCTFLGTGGGGNPKKGIESLMSELEKGNEVGWIEAGSIGDDELTCCPFLMGSIAPQTEEVKKEKEWFGLTEPKHIEKGILAEAVKELSNFTNKKISALVPIELGGSNTPSCVAAGVSIGIPILDGDYTGRAIPEIQQTTPYLKGKELLPYTCVDLYGNTSIVTKAVSYRFGERVGKLISSASYGLTGDAGFIMTGKETKDTIIEGTLTKCYNVGKLIREKREAGENPVKAVAEYLDGWVVGKGTVVKKEWEDKLGYYWGTHTIKGEGEFEGEELKIWFKNENHVCWKNDEVFITSPDSVNVVEAKTGEPITNSDLKEGDEVAVVALKAVEMFKSDKGVDILGPKAFGFDYEYSPIENRL